MKSSGLSVIKNRICILTIVDRKTRCILGWAVVWVGAQEAIQDVVDRAPKAKQYTTVMGLMPANGFG
jgi:hypothetical protein